MDRARAKALEVLNRWEKRGSVLDPLFDQLVMKESLLTDLDKAFVRKLVYGVVRWRGRLDWIIAAYSRIKPRRMERAVLSILRMGAYQILFMDRVPVQAAVDESVKLAKGLRKQGVVPFVNGVLRGIAEGRKEVAYPDLQAAPLEYIAAYHSHPRWMVRKWLAQWGVDETISLCEANNCIPPLTVRVNTCKGSRDEVIKRLTDEKIAARPTPFSPVGLIIQNPPPLSAWDLLQEGWLQVQDEAAQLITSILDPRHGERVLDVCAAPGGKTTHLASVMADQGEIVAVDVSPARLGLVEENCCRLGISIVKAMSLDATCPLPFPAACFDRVLVDAPCTGLGTLRRNPEGKWRVLESDIPRLQKLQRAILAQAAPLVRQGGVLVYSTCTMTPEENEGVIEAFLSAQEGFDREGISPFLPPGCDELTDHHGYYRTVPHCQGMDGFFAARLRRS
jgi:16S rRNA (cytosine967-C5)-methyltransferase